MKKGFTLIELLAVIVVLAVIALIAVPIIANVIEKSKQNSIIQTINSYIDTFEKTILKNYVDNNSESYKNIDCTLNNQNIMKCNNEQEIKLYLKGNTLDTFNITTNNKGIISEAIWKKDNYCGLYTEAYGVKITKCNVINSLLVSFTPNDSTWNVNNVADALNYLYGN